MKDKLDNKYLNAFGEEPMGYRELAKKLGVNVKTAGSACTSLVKRGLLKVADHKGYYKSARYVRVGALEYTYKEVKKESDLMHAIDDRINGELRRELSLRISDTIEEWIGRNVCCATTIIGDGAAPYATAISESSAISALKAITKAIRMMAKGPTGRTRNKVKSIVEKDLTAMGVKP